MRHLPLLALLACDPASDGDVAVDPMCDGAGDELVLLDRTILFARAADGVCDGFDLDGESTAEGAPTGCGVADYTAPDGTPGVDNAFANMLPALDATEAQAAEELVQQTIAGGGLLLATRITDLDDPWNDPCVTVEIMRLTGEPLLGNDGYVLPYQTFTVDDAVPIARAEGVALVDGVIVATGLEIVVPIQIFVVTLDLVLHDAAIRLTHVPPEGDTGALPEGSWRVLFGGGVEASQIQSVADEEDVDDALSGLVAALLAANVDLAPVGGVCTQLSMTFSADAIPTFLEP